MRAAKPHEFHYITSASLEILAFLMRFVKRNGDQLARQEAFAGAAIWDRSLLACRFLRLA